MKTKEPTMVCARLISF